MSKPIDKLEFWKERIDTAVSEHYSVYVVHEVGWKKIFEKHREIIEEYIPPEARVLDAGCGYGRMSQLFSPELYTGIDFSPDFIEKAKKKYPEYEFRVENLKALPFKDKEFDWGIVVSIKKMVRDNLGDEQWQIMEDEIRRVCNEVLVLEYEEPEIFEVL